MIERYVKIFTSPEGVKHARSFSFYDYLQSQYPSSLPLPTHPYAPYLSTKNNSKESELKDVLHGKIFQFL